VTSPAPDVDADLSGPSEAPARRRRARSLLAIVPVVALLLSLSACSPEAMARDAVDNWWGTDTECAMRIVARESGYDPNATNRSTGATGLFQLMPMHAKWVKERWGYTWADMKDANKNARAARHLANTAKNQTGDVWQPWRGRAAPGAGCPF